MVFIISEKLFEHLSLLIVKRIAVSHLFDGFMSDGDMKRFYGDGFLGRHNIAVTVAFVNRFRFCFFGDVRRDLIHYPKDVFQFFYFVIGHSGNLLRVIGIHIQLYRIDGDHFFPLRSGFRHFKNIIIGRGFLLFDHTVIIVVDFRNSGSHRNSGTGIFPGVKDTES